MFPPWHAGFLHQTTSFATLSITSSAGAAMMGRLYINGEAPEKLFSSAGGKISFRSGGTNVWTALSLLAIGIQDVDLAAGPPMRPDGTFDVSTTITSSTVAYPASTWNTWTMTSGSKSMSHGELYAVVVRMQSRISTDQASIAVLTAPFTSGTFPCCASVSNSTVWAASSSMPNVSLEFDDGTVGWLHGGFAISNIASRSISSGSANNEYGMRFVMPWTAQVNAWGVKVLTNGVGTFKTCLYSDPNGTPTTITSVEIDGNTHPGLNAYCYFNIPLQTPVTLTVSTTFMLSVISNTLSAVAIQAYTFPSETHKLTLGGGSSLAEGARAGGAGAFSMNEVSVPACFHIRCHQILDTTVTATTTTTITTTITVGGAGGGMVIHPGMTGGVRG